MQVQRIDRAKVIYWLRRRDKSQRWLATKLRKPETDLSHLLRGRLSASDALVRRMAAALEVDVAEILATETAQ